MIEPTAALLLSEELIDEDDDDVYMAGEDEEEDDELFDYEAVAGTEMDMMDSSFDYLAEDVGSGEAELVEENPFEPVYPANAGLLFAAIDEDESFLPAGDDNGDVADAKYAQGRVLEPINLDNILPEGSRRRRGRN